MVRRGRWLVPLLATAIVVGAVGRATAQSGTPPRDVDDWHESFKAAIGGPYLDDESRGWDLGIYPSFALALGPPEWVAVQASGYLSIAKRSSFSLFVGYGYERAVDSESHLATIGWGGVLRLPGARQQRGFYGKFLRYRRLDDAEHGIHHGLSVGSEAGVGVFGFTVEVGAARSPQNHWALTVQFAAKLALPIILPIGHGEDADPRE